MPGIYRGEDWLYGIVHVRGAGDIDKKTRKRKAAFREKRFPLSVPLGDIVTWQQQERAKLLEHADRGTAPGTFKRDARGYLKDLTGHLAHPGTRKVEITHWIKELGDKPRGTIKPADISRIRSKWRSEGTSAKTVNNRCDALRAMYHALDGRTAWTPLDDLDALPVHKTPIRVIDNALILAVDQRLQELEQLGKRKGGICGPKTRARHRVYTSTGRRPSEIGRAERGDIDLDRRIWLPRDGKGGFSPGLYLNDDMLAAWSFFIEVNAFGPFDTDEHARRLYKAGWPEDIQPYHARHTVGITLSEKGVDLQDVGPMMGHRRMETTRRHYVPVLNSRMQKASEAIAGRFKGWPTVQTTVQHKPAKRRKSRTKSSTNTNPPTRRSQREK